MDIKSNNKEVAFNDQNITTPLNQGSYNLKKYSEYLKHTEDGCQEEGQTQ